MTDSSNPSAPQPEPGGMRASDTDRDNVAARLREALAEGLLSPDEHSERLDTVYSVRTMGELVPVTSDLPAPQETTGQRPVRSSSPRPIYGAERVGGDATGHVSLALMGGSVRSGDWVVPANYFALAAMGGIGIDLREARFAQREVTIFANAVMGGVEITVPDDIEVRVNGIGIMGGFGAEGAPSSVVEPGAPIVNVTGLALMGGVGVVYRKRKHQKKDKTKGRKEIAADEE